MASGTAADGGSLELDSIPIVDLRLLSQSELYSLSLCSSTAFDPRRWDDAVVPKIDRSVFNESAGSRKQTYSRLRLAPPSSSSASSSTARRRTPHLRPAAATFAKIQTNTSDPENADNSHIVALLKQLFVADLNPGDLVPVKIDYSDSLPAQQFLSLPSSFQSSVYPRGHKRKRGRPRRDEILGVEGGLAPGVGVAEVSADVDRFSSLNEVFVHENMEDRDRDVLNTDGVVVDLVALGAVEHPYGEEIRRRTEGLTTEEELLGFLKELNGEWGSRRKKKRIVDANEFGAALPVGWKLSLSVKNKDGQAWLNCRCYISPSGLHFVTCKGVSSYLLSLRGVQDRSLPNSSQPYEIINDADKLTTIMVTSENPDLAVEEDHRSENVVNQTSSSAIDSTSGNHEIQVIKSTEDFPNGGGEILRCDKCNVTFSQKDKLLQHQSSHQRNRLKNGVRITDGVIIKDGKYECQFCHKTFDERHRYNGHVGTHVRSQAKIAGESLAGNLGKSVDLCSVGETIDPSSFGEIPLQDTAMHVFLNSEKGINMCSVDNKDSENVGYSEEANGTMRGVGEAADIVTETDQCEVADVVLSSDSNKSFCTNDCAAEKINDDTQQGRSGNSSPLPVDATATNGLKNVGAIGNSLGTQQPEKCVVSKSSLLDSNQHVEECDDVYNDFISEARNEAELDSEDLSISGSLFDFFGAHGDNTSTCGSMASKLNIVPNVNMLPRSQDEKTCGKDDVPDLISKCKVDDTCRFGICDKDIYQEADDALSRHEEMESGISAVAPSWNDQERVPKKSNAVTTCLLKEPVVQNRFKSRLVAFSGHESMCGIENNDDEVCGRRNKVSEFDHYQTSGHDESADPFNSSNIELNSYSIMGNLQDIQLGVCSGPSSAANKQFSQEDNMMRIFDGASGEQRQGQPRGVSPSRHDNDPGNHSKLNASETNGKHELSLSFGNRLAELCRDSSRVELESYQIDRVNQSVDNFNIQSVVHKTFGDQTDLSTRNNNMPGDLNQGRPYQGDISDSPFKIETPRVGSSFNVARSEDQMGTSGQTFTVAFGNGSSQSGMADDCWSTGHENVFQGTLDATARLQIPSSNYFGNFGLTSDKGEGASCGVTKNYTTRTDMLRPARTEPVEYRFLGNENSNCMPGEESKIFSFTANTEEGLDPSFWLGKDALMPSYTSQSNQLSSICIWCRNSYYHQADEYGTQSGAIGSMCPSCSSRIPGQFNVL